MAKKKCKGDGIFFLGQSAEDVTGSQYLINFGDKHILLECGMHQSQSNSYLDSYRVNSTKFGFNPKKIDYLFVPHPHIDHCGLIPRLVKEGFNGKIITTMNTALVMEALLLNSAFIVSEEARVLSKRYNRKYEPLYERQDVYDALSLVEVYNEYDTVIKLDDNVSFQWLKNSHCIGAAQLQLILSNEMKTKKILYTSDIGALETRNHFLENTEIPKMYNDVTIMESTYGSDTRITKKTRDFDVEHFRVAVETVLSRGGSVVMPCFSFSRTQELLATIYELFGDRKDFKYDVVIDSKLSCEITDLYAEMIPECDKKFWDDVMNWDNLCLIEEKEQSQMCLADDSPKIVLSSSGFCTNGRIVNYLKKYLQDENSMIIFSGYVGDNPTYLSYRIKNFSDRETLKINKEEIPNRADCITLSTFSSHANHEDLVKFGSSLLTNKLILVHGSEESKRCLAEKLKDAISKNDKTYKVVCSNIGMVVHL